MKLIEVKTSKKTHYINPEYIVSIREWIVDSTWVITLTKGEEIFIKRENVDKILKDIGNEKD